MRRRAPDHVDALTELAHLELARLYPPVGDTAQCLARARDLLARALTRAPGHARSLNLLGHVEGSAGRQREALQLTEMAVANDPTDPEGHTMRAARFTSLGFWESAVVASDAAATLDPVWEAPHRMKVYVLSRMGRPDAARVALEELARVGTSPIDLAIARFDLRMAEGDFAGAEKELACLERLRPLSAEQESRCDIARALARAQQGDRRHGCARLAAHASEGPRFWDHTIRLALAVGDDERARALLMGNPVNRSYRWLASEALVAPYLERPEWRSVADELHASWMRALDEFGPGLPVQPPTLPTPDELMGPKGRARAAAPPRRARSTDWLAARCTASRRTNDASS